MHDRVPALDRDVLEIAARDAGGVVDQDVDPAELLDGLARHPAADVDVGEISGNRHRLVPRGDEPRGDVARGVRFQPVNHHARAERREVLRDPQADAGGRSRDECDLVVQGSHGAYHDHEPVDAFAGVNTT